MLSCVICYSCFLVDLCKNLAPVIVSPGNFMLEELTSDHIRPLRCKKTSNPRPARNKTTSISDAKFSECLRNPNDLLRPVSTQLSALII